MPACSSRRWCRAGTADGCARLGGGVGCVSMPLPAAGAAGVAVWQRHGRRRPDPQGALPACAVRGGSPPAVWCPVGGGGSCRAWGRRCALAVGASCAPRAASLGCVVRGISRDSGGSRAGLAARARALSVGLWWMAMSDIPVSAWHKAADGSTCIKKGTRGSAVDGWGADTLPLDRRRRTEGLRHARGGRPSACSLV